MNRRTDAAERFAERRRQEDEAPRLRDAVPELLTCKIELSTSRASSVTPDVTHTRHLIVDRASTMIFVACSDPACRDGGYDIGSTIVRGLRDRRTEIRGDDACNGNVGAAHCGRLLQYRAIATFGGTRA